MKLRAIFNQLKQSVKNVFVKPQPRQTQPTTQYTPFTVAKFQNLAKKHKLHKYQFGTFSPVKKIK